MYRGETITTAISDLPVSVYDIKSLRIVFHTITKTILEKTLDDCIITDGVIECTITQEESLLFGCGPVTRSVIIVTNDGARFERQNTEMVCAQTGKRGVLT